MSVTIVSIAWSPTKHRIEVCRESMRSLVEHTLMPFTWVVVDNGPIEQTEMLRELINPEYLLTQKENIGIPEARNLGAETGPKTDYIVFCDTDMEFTDGWLEDALAYLESHNLPLIVTCHAASHMMERSRSIGRLDGWTLWTRSAGGAIVMPRPAYDKVGPWPATWRMGYDFSTQVFHAGYRFVLAEPPSVLHADRKRSYSGEELKKTGRYVKRKAK